MCMFSSAVNSVNNTRIFVRRADGRQHVAYSMDLHAMQAVAMILPIPVDRSAGEDAVSFVDMSGYADFFDDLDHGFAQPKFVERSFSLGGDRGLRTLAVHDVGSFEASFVPTLADFQRLDPRFRLPDQTWARLPQYREFGFVVFKLRNGVGPAHPMAFSYPTQIERIFFPTVHVHDGEVHPFGDFDHTLYAQDNSRGDLAGTEKSFQTAQHFMRNALGSSVLAFDQYVYKQTIQGSRPNTDILI